MKVSKTRLEFYKESLEKAKTIAEFKRALTLFLLAFSHDVVSRSEDNMKIQNWLEENVDCQDC